MDGLNDSSRQDEGRLTEATDQMAEQVTPTAHGAETVGQTLPGRRIQSVELAVFLLLIVPSMATSFLLGGGQGGPGFMVTAVASILSDLGLVCLVLYFVWRNGEPVRLIGWSLSHWPREVAIGIGLFFPAAFGADFLETALHQAGLSAPTKLPSFLTATGSERIIMAVILVIVVAIVEETIFRGYLIRRFTAMTRSTVAAVFLSALVFSLGHGYEGLAGVISVFCLGIVFALVYLWRRSLVAPMVMHFLIDFTSIVLVSWFQSGR